MMLRTSKKSKKRAPRREQNKYLRKTSITPSLGGVKHNISTYRR